MRIMVFFRNLLCVLYMGSSFGESKLCGEWQRRNTLIGNKKNDFFGSTVATSADGKIFAVGAPRGGDSSSSRSSYVEVFEINPSTNTIQSLGANNKIVPKTKQNLPMERAGSSISLSGDGKIIAIANIENNNPSDDDPTVNVMSGGVSVYRLVTISSDSGDYSEWQQMGETVFLYGGFLQTSASVELSKDGETFVFASSGSGIEIYGKIKIFRFNSASNKWDQKGKTVREKYSGSFMSGKVSVSISEDGNLIAIGSSRNSDMGKNSGRVRVFEYSNEAWQLRGEILSGSTDHDHFGSSVALSNDGDVLVVGSDGSFANTGKVSIFKFDENTAGQWVQTGEDIVGTGIGSYFGSSIGISSTTNGTILAIGAYGENKFRGSTSIYQLRSSETWMKVGESIVGMGEKFFSGASVALSSDGKQLVVGSPFTTQNSLYSGAVSTFNFVSKQCISASPSASPSALPSLSAQPTMSQSPSANPSLSQIPSSSPTDIPTFFPSGRPSISETPSISPTRAPTHDPTISPSSTPSYHPSLQPSVSPTPLPSREPSGAPISSPSNSPSETASSRPTHFPTRSQQPTTIPSISISPSEDLIQIDVKVNALDDSNSAAGFLVKQVLLVPVATTIAFTMFFNIL